MNAYQRSGPTPTPKAEQIAQARQLLPDNGVASIARLLKVSRATLYAHVPEFAARRALPTARSVPATSVQADNFAPAEPAQGHP